MSLEDKMNEWDAIHHLASKSEAKPTLHYRKFDTDKQEIVLMGDEHLGAKTYQEYEHLKNVEWCYENKVPIILLGDELETATRHSVGAGVYEQQEILEQQMEHFYHIYRPLAKEGLILGQHIGGHEARAFKESGVNVTKIMCKELKIPYFGIGKFHHFRVGNQGYDLYTTHGASGARLPHTKIKATLDLAHAMAVEIYCFDEETELMTEDGFKKVDEFKEGDIIFNFKVNNREIQRDRIKGIIKKESGTMTLKNRFLEMELTPEHRVLYQTCTKKGNLFFKEAKQISKETGQIKIPCAGHQKIEEYGIQDELISLIGWVISEGHFKNEKSNRKGIGIYQSIKNKENCDEIRSLLEKLNLKYSENINRGCITFYIWNESGERIREYLAEKNLPPWCFNLSERQFELLLDALVKGDGHWQNNKSGQYYSKNKDLIEKLQILLTINGYRSKMKSRVGGFSNSINFEVSFHKKDYFTIPLSKVNFEDNKGIKKVWCISTNNGTVIVRKNGRVFISGNCMGHLHQLTHHTRHFYRIDKRNKKVIQASKDFIISGGYVGYWGSYAHMKNLEPVKIGSAKLKLHGTEKLVRVSL